jgi:multisubunit Na+/H+ antiporter MnhE subunit
MAWWIGLSLIWLLLVDTLDWAELVVGAAAAALVAIVAVAMHRLGYIRFWPRAVWLRELPYLVATIASDCVLLARALWQRTVRRRDVQGTTIRVPFHHGGANSRDGARRALVNLAVSITPNTYVVDIDPESDTLLVHQLVATGPDRVLRRERDRAAQARSTAQGSA